MRRLRWLLIIGTVLAAVVAVGAWVLPGLLDWSRYRGELALLASDTLGRRVQIDGPVTLSLLPQPMLTASGVTVDEPGGGISITARQLRLRVALGALFFGHVDAQELVLHGVDMHAPWPLQPDAFALQAPTWLSSLSARIEDGRFTIGNIVLTGINATLTTSDFSGTYMAAGTAQLSGRPWRFTARLSRPGGDGSAGLDVSMDGQGAMQGAGASLSGQILADGTLAGRIVGRGPDLSQLLPAPAIPFRAEGRVSVAAGLAVADQLVVDLGGSPARGAVALRVTSSPRLDVALAASRLDLNAWLPALMRGAQSDLLTRLPTSIDLSADAAQLYGGTLRDLRGAFDMASGAVMVRELRAALPGDASFRTTGRFTVPDLHARPPRPAHYDGDASITAPSLRTTLAWLQAAGIDVIGQLPAQVLRRAQLSGHAAIDPGQIALDNLTGTVDGSTVGGSLTLRLGSQTPPTHPRIGAGLTLDRLELDPWLPTDFSPTGPIPTWLSALDVDLRLGVKQAMLKGVGIAPLSLDATVEAGRLTLRKLDATVNGVHAAASGTLASDGRISDARLDIQAPQASALADLLSSSLGPLSRASPSIWHGPANLQVTAAGSPQAVGLRVSADMADLRLDAQPTVDLQTGNWAGPITLRHPGAPRLAEALGIANATAWLGDGSLSLVAQVSRNGGRFAADSFEVTAGSLHATGTLAVQATPSGPSVTGRVAAETLPLPLPSLRSTDPLPFTWLTGWQAAVKLDAGRVLANQAPVLSQLSTTMTLADGLLQFEGLSAKPGGGLLDGTLSVDASEDTPAILLDAQLSDATIAGPLFDMPLDVTTGTLSASMSLSATGHSPAGLLATLGGAVNATIRHGTLVGVDLARATEGGGDAPPALTDAAVNAALAEGTMPFDELDVVAQASLGAVRLDQTRLTAPSGTMLVTGTVDLTTAAADLRLALRPAVPVPPEIGLRLSGPIGALRRTPELADLARWRAEHEKPRAKQDQGAALNPHKVGP
jgi:AsmA-like C-terminal region/AsmA family